MTISKLEDLGLTVTTNQQESRDKVTKSEAWDQRRDDQYQGELDRTHQQESNKPPPASEQNKG